MLGVNNLASKPPVGRSEYGRVKVALPKGKGLMDWVRLSTSKILAKRRISTVDDVELIKHNTKEDCWVLLFGQVYDVTSYLDFHPGGIDELMRAAGRDGTALFNQYHPWVNYESMLKSCFVGKFLGDPKKLPECDPTTVNESTEKNEYPAKLLNESSSNDAFRKLELSSTISIKIQENTLILSSVDWKYLSNKNVTYEINKIDLSLRILVRCFNVPTTEVTYEYIDNELTEEHVELMISENIVILKFNNLKDLSEILDNSKRKIRKRPTVKYHNCIVKEVANVSHDTFLYDIIMPTGLYMPIPIAHHVSLKIRKGLVAVYRPYTPIRYSLPANDTPGSLSFLVKVYPEGQCTQLLTKLIPGDKIEISDPIGDFNIIDWIGNEDALLFAAGTGITPMIPIIESRYGCENKTTLILFNKTEKDIVVDNLPFVRWIHGQTTIHHVLSSPSSQWTGLSGRINIKNIPTIQDKTKILICGPDGFIEAAVNLLAEQKISSSRIHIFKG